MDKTERLQALQNIINNIVNNSSQFVDARALLAALTAIHEDMKERYTPEELDPNSPRFDPLHNRIIQS